MLARQPSVSIAQTSGVAPRMLPSEPNPTIIPARVPKAAAGYSRAMM